MNWVKLKSYEDGAFALGEILNRFESDVAEANRLPEWIRRGRTFGINRDGEYHASIYRESQEGRSVRLALRADMDAVSFQSQVNRTLDVPIRAVPDPVTGEVRWCVDDLEPVPLWELSRNLLGRYVFEF